MKSIPVLAPSDLDYLPKNVQDAGTKKKYNIATNSYPPPVFSNFDVIQQQYLNTRT